MWPNKTRWFYLLLLLIVASVSFWSYSLVDKNLILLPYDWSFAWQKWWWSWGDNRQFLVNVFLGWLGIWWLLWGVLASRLNFQLNFKKWLLWLAPIYLILLIGYNALSHDIFNYLFNAKLVAVYGVNPHVVTAMDFLSDPWTRFMHNIHTPAPYGYGWTGISLLPIVLSGGKFLIAYALMKILMLAGLVLLLLVIWRGLKYANMDHPGTRFAWLALHPLLLMETLLNGHNDVWMMWPAVLAVLMARFESKQKFQWLIVLALWILSVSIKLASVALLPLILGLFIWQYGHRWWQSFTWLSKLTDWFRHNWAEWAACLMFLPLLTARSQWFHPWYLIWPLSFLPFIKWRWLRWAMIGLSISSMVRYVPWMLSNLEYSEQILQQMRWITWSGGLLAILFWLISFGFTKVNKNKY